MKSLLELFTTAGPLGSRQNRFAPDIRCLVFLKKNIAVSVEFLRGVLSGSCLSVFEMVCDLLQLSQTIFNSLINTCLGRLVEMVYHPRDRMFLGLCERCQVG